ELLLLVGHVQNVGLEVLVDVDHVTRVLHAVPGHVRDMQQAVDAAQVDERAELGDVLDDALAGLARLDGREQLALETRPIFLKQLATRYDDVPPHLVDLEDHALDFFVDVIADVRRPADVHLAGRQEYVDADVDEQAALDLARDEALDPVAFLVLGENRLPFLLPFGLAVGERDDAVLVFDGLEQDLNRIADLGVRGRVDPFFFPFLNFDDAFRLVADVDQDVLTADVADASFDDLVGLVDRGVFAEPVGDFLLEVSFQVAIQRGFEVADIDLVDEVAIGH